MIRAMQHRCERENGPCGWGMKCICNCTSCWDSTMEARGDELLAPEPPAAKPEMVTFLVPIACRDGHDPLPDELPVAKEGVTQILIKFCRTCHAVYWVHA